MKSDFHKFIAIVWCVCFFSFLSSAQSSINACGGSVVNLGGSTSYSIGQVAFTSKSGISGKVNEGVQHSYEIYLVGTFDTDFDVPMNLFPNPTSGVLTLEVPGYDFGSYLYVVFDGGGREIIKGSLQAVQSQIILENMQPAVYYLHVLHADNRPVKTFKIIKK